MRRFAGWVARGSVGYPLFDRGYPTGVALSHPQSTREHYWDVLREEPSQMETLFAIFANCLEFDETGEPTNENAAERRAASYLYWFITRELPSDQEPFDGSPDVELY